MSTPDYVLNAEFNWIEGQEVRTLNVGCFVRPVEIQYVPEHVKADERWARYKEKKYMFVWCSQGFVLIPRELVRRT